MRRELQAHDEFQDVERVARSVLSVLDRRIEPGEIKHVLDALPKDVRRLWRETLQVEDIQ